MRCEPFQFSDGKYLLFSTAYCMIFRKLNIENIYRKLNIENIYRKWYEGLVDIVRINVRINVLLHSIVDVMEKGGNV